MVRNKWNNATSEFEVHICIKTSAPTADMDALSLDQMLPEYQQSKQEVEHEIEELHRGDSSLPEDLDTYNSSTDTYSNELSNSDTVPVSDVLSEPDPGIASKAEGNRPATMDSTSSTSSSVESYKQPSSSGSTSLYQAGFTAPTITYERDNDNQKLIAVIGREFDCPPDISVSLQKLTSKQPNSSVPVAKFVPFTVKRKMLLRGSFDNRELRKHDLICMCYNASEARLLLTGVDGFYSSLLKYVEAYLGRFCFITCTLISRGLIYHSQLEKVLSRSILAVAHLIKRD